MGILLILCRGLRFAKTRDEQFFTTDYAAFIDAGDMQMIEANSQLPLHEAPTGNFISFYLSP